LTGPREGYLDGCGRFPIKFQRDAAEAYVIGFSKAKPFEVASHRPCRTDPEKADDDSSEARAVTDHSPCDPALLPGNWRPRGKCPSFGRLVCPPRTPGGCSHVFSGSFREHPSDPRQHRWNRNQALCSNRSTWLLSNMVSSRSRGSRPDSSPRLRRSDERPSDTHRSGSPRRFFASPRGADGPQGREHTGASSRLRSIRWPPNPPTRGFHSCPLPGRCRMAGGSSYSKGASPSRPDAGSGRSVSCRQSCVGEVLGWIGKVCSVPGSNPRRKRSRYPPRNGSVLAEGCSIGLCRA